LLRIPAAADRRGCRAATEDDGPQAERDERDDSSTTGSGFRGSPEPRSGEGGSRTLRFRTEVYH
jgi:hypothetical protein